MRTIIRRDEKPVRIQMSFKHTNGVYDRENKTFINYPKKSTECFITIQDTNGVESRVNTIARVNKKDSFNKNVGRYVAFKKALAKINHKNLLTKSERRELCKIFFSSSPTFQDIYKKLI